MGTKKAGSSLMESSNTTPAESIDFIETIKELRTNIKILSFTRRLKIKNEFFENIYNF